MPSTSTLAMLGLALSTLLPAPVRAAVPEEKDGNWLELRTPHFVVRSNGSEGMARGAAGKFEQMHAVFAQLFPNAPAGEAHPFIVVGAKDEKTIKSLIPEYWEGREEKPWALYIPQRWHTYMTLRTDIDGQTWNGRYSLPYWGYANHVISQQLPNLPLWAHRGLVEFYAHTTVEGERVLIGRASEQHIATLRDQPFLPLARLLAADRHSPEWTDEKRRRFFDAESWALVHYLLLGDKGTQREKLGRYLDAAARGDAAAGQAALGDLARLEDDLANYVRRNTFFTQVLSAAIDVEAKGFPVRRLSAAEAYAMRGALHVALERWGDATAAIDRALALDKDLAAAHEALAAMELKRDHRSEARAAAEKALAADAQSVLAAQILKSLDVKVSYGPVGVAPGPGATRMPPPAEVVKKVEADCEGGRSEACLTLAEMLIGGSGGQRDEARGLDVLQARCAKGDEVVCNHLVQRLRQGAGVTRDLPRALAVEEQRCTAGHAASCLAAGVEYLTGAEGVEAKPDKAIALMEAACDKGERNACGALATAFETGQVPKDTHRAVELYAKGCALGDAPACTQAGVLKLGGMATASDYAQAAKLFEKGCEAGEPVGCSNLASLLRVGRGVARDVARARALYAKACDKGHAAACAEKARLSAP